ncbi:MAG TPA: glutathione peroxidase [Candidatus Limnocylindrales bacterium]|nr:glutathione peroxidase [Candidatus Limnocylindrales bacterium]
MTQATKEGTRIPEVTFRTRDGGSWKDVSTRELFAGKNVVVFALPGAFTPTCSATHLPRYEELAPALRSAGIDEIVCLSVNDGFVMEAWGRDQNVRNVRLIPDGNGEFTRAMGMLVDKADLGFGPRSWRYSMLVEDGVIRKMFVEPHKDGDPFEVSDADTMLAYVSPQTADRANVVVFTKSGCPHCTRAKNALAAAGMPYREIEISGVGGIEALRAVSGASTVPQVFIDGVRIGGADDLERHLAAACATTAAA